jgi:aspartyl-tRNA(Asn)/glutamyl-tRNA(Gln) amidotransferase subunit C
MRGVAIDDSEVRRIAGLAQLELDEATTEIFRHQLGSILDHVARLAELDGAPAPHADLVPATGGAHLREDVEVPGLSRSEALGNAPDAAAGHFRVPRILEP